jgi:NRPS condensation-like uncharacterized protein
MHSVWSKGDAGWYIGLQMEFDQHLDEELLARALDLLVDAEPVLGCRLVLDGATAHWERVPPQDRHLFTESATEAEHEAYRTTALDAIAGPQVALNLWRQPDKDSVYLKITHQVGDGAGIFDVAKRLCQIYTTLVDNQDYVPEPNLTGSRDWDQIMEHVPAKMHRRILIRSLLFLLPRMFPIATQNIPMPEGPILPWKHVIRRIAPERVAAIAAYGKARNATLTEMFLAALYRALAAESRWSGKPNLRIWVTFDMRRWYIPGGRAQGICNLAGMEFPFVGRRLGKNFDDTLRKVSSAMTKRKNDWPGIASALFSANMAKQEARGKESKLEAEWRRAPVFSNTGTIAQENVSFAGVTPSRAYILGPTYSPGQLIVTSGYAGEITMSVGVAERGVEALSAFFDDVLAQLPDVKHAAAGAATAAVRG